MIDFSFSLGAYENLKLVNSEGFEFNFVSSITDNILLSGSYSKTDSTNEAGVRLIRLPEEKANLNFNYFVFLAWILSAGTFYYWSKSQNLFLSFLTLPAWILCGLLFILMSKFFQKRSL